MLHHSSVIQSIGDFKERWKPYGEGPGQVISRAFCDTADCMIVRNNGRRTVPLGRCHNKIRLYSGGGGGGGCTQIYLSRYIGLHMHEQKNACKGIFFWVTCICVMGSENCDFQEKRVCFFILTWKAMGDIAIANLSVGVYVYVFVYVPVWLGFCYSGLFFWKVEVWL